MKSILKYSSKGIQGIMLIVLISTINSVSAQENDLRIRGLRLGYDLSKLSNYVFRPEQTEIEFSLDMEVARNTYTIVEFGLADIDFSASNYDYEASGYFIRAGVDRNLLKKLTVNQYEMLYGGIRYGFASFNQEARNIQISDPYWGDFSGGAVPRERVNAHWVEINVGLRGEIFRNFFIGWGFRGRILIDQSAGEYMAPYLIPGFGVFDNKKTNIGFTYSIYYRIPIYKVEYKERQGGSKKSDRNESEAVSE